METEFGWEPLTVPEVAELFTGAPFRWWISAGHALELHVGQTWRDHDDVDVGISRGDAGRAYRWLDGWHLAVASRGCLSSWNGRPLEADRNENNVWARRSPDGPWRFDITVGAGTEGRWIYRRDRSITRRWGEAVLFTADGVPYLAPEIQLLFKSRSRRPKDDLDVEQAASALSASLDPSSPGTYRFGILGSGPWSMDGGATNHERKPYDRALGYCGGRARHDCPDPTPAQPRRTR